MTHHGGGVGYYPYHSGGGAANSIGAMLLLSLVFISLIVFFSFAAYMDYTSCQTQCPAPGPGRVSKVAHVVKWVQHGGQAPGGPAGRRAEGGGDWGVPSARPSEDGGRSEKSGRGSVDWGVPVVRPLEDGKGGRGGGDWGVPFARPAQDARATARGGTIVPIGEAVRPPWSRGGAVGDADVHNAIMSSATVGSFFRSPLRFGA